MCDIASTKRCTALTGSAPLVAPKEWCPNFDSSASKPSRLPADTMIITLINETSAFAIWTIWDNGQILYDLTDQYGVTKESESLPNARVLLTGLLPASVYRLNVQDITGMNAPIEREFRTGPSPASDIEVIEDESDVFQSAFTWTPSPDAEFYRPSLVHPDGREEPHPGGDVPSTGPLVATFTGLVPDSRYELVVRSGLVAYETFPETLGRAMSADYTTDAIANATITTTGRTSTSISLAITPPHQRVTLLFIVYYVGNTRISTFFRDYPVADGPPPVTEVTLTGLNPATTYRLDVSWHVGSTERQDAEDVFVSTLPPSPTGFNVSSGSNSNSVTLSWNPPVPSDNLVGYRIMYSPSEDGGETELYAGPDDRTMVIGNLVPGIPYTILLSSRVQSQGSDDILESEPVAFPFTIGSTAGQPYVLSKTNSSIEYIWEQLTGSRYFVLRYVPSGNRIEVPGSRHPSYLIDDLVSGAEYELSVEHYNVNLQLIGNFSVDTTTDPNPPGPITIVSVEQTSANLSLEEPSLPTTYTGYEISFQRNGSNVETPAGSASADDEYFSVEGLNADTLYAFYVRAVSGTGPSRGISEPSVVKDRTSTLQPGQIIVQSVSTTTITFEYGRDNETAGPVTYFATYSPMDGAILLDTTARRVFLTGLVPGRSYTLTLTAVGNTESVNTKSTRTVPLQPTSLSLMPDVLNIRMTWSAPLGSIVNGYEVSIDGAQYRDVPSDTNTLTIVGREPSMTYEVAVCSISEDLNARRTSSLRTQSVTTLSPHPFGTISASVTSTTVDVYFGNMNSQAIYLVSLLDSGNSVLRPYLYVVPPRASYDNLEPSTLYTIRVLDTATGQEATTTLRTNPPSPGPVTILDTTPTSITVTWERADGDIDYVDGYVLSYVGSSGIETETVSSNPCDPNQYTLTGLNPDSFYTIIVKTQLREVAGMFSEQEGDTDSSIMFNTEPVPEDVIMVRSRTTTTLNLVWNAVSLSNLVISYRPSDSENPPVQFAVSGSTGTQTLTNLQPGTLYSFELLLNNNPVASGTGRIVPRQPGTLSLITMTSTDLTISWQPQTGVVDLYRIIASELDLDGCPQTVERTVNGDVQSVTFSRLLPDRRYMVTVKAVAGINQDQTESTAQFNTFRTAVAQQGEVFVRNVTSYFMEILFETIESLPSTSPHSVVISPPTNDGIDVISILGDSRIVEITALTPGQTYTFYVERNNVQGPVGQITANPLPPENVQVLNDRTTQTSLTLSWDPPTLPSPSPAPVVEQYVIEVFQEGSPVKIENVDGDATEATVDELEVSTEYDIHVTSVSGVGIDNARSETVMRTASTVTPLPGEILVIAYMSNTIDFVWGDSSNEPGFVRDDLTYEPETSTSSLTVTGTRHGRLSGVRPGALYSIHLMVVATNPQQDTAMQRTIPLAPTGLAVITQSPLSVTFSWSLGDTELDNFIIFYSLRGEDFEAMVSPSVTTYELTNLEPDTSYIFSMVTVSRDERSPAVTTSGSTVPLNGNVILAAETTATSVRAWFTPITTASGPYGVTRPGQSDLSIQENDPLTFTLTGLSPGTEYEIEISRMDQSYRDSVRTNPPNPGTVDSIDPGRFTAEFSFSAGSPPEAVDFYEIYRLDDGTCRVLGNPSCCSRVLIAALAAAAPLTYTDTGLNPNTTYVYEIGSLLSPSGDFPEQRSNLVEIFDIKTDVLPERTVDVRETTTTTINLVWLTTGVDSGAFFITFSAASDSQSTARTLTVEPDVIFVEYILDSLTPGELYSIRVQSGDNALNDEITQRTRPNPIAGFAASPVTSTTITVNWEDATGVVSYYEVVYDPPNGQSPRRTDVQVEEPNTLTLSGLFPNFDYTVTILTWSGTGEDATSSTPVSQLFTTAQIQSLQIIVRFVNETQVQLTWGLVAGEDRYLVTVEDGDQVTIPADVTVPEGESPLTLIVGLTPGTLYTARVRSQTLQRNGTEQFRTTPNRPSSLTVTDQTPNSLTVSWTAPPAGGVVDEYLLSYSIGDRIRTEVGRFETDVTTATIPNLNTATTYNIYLVAVANEEGYPESSDEITAQGTTEIPAPGEIVIINQTPTSFRFQWGPSPDQGVTYITTYNPPDGTKVDTLSIWQSDVTGATPGRLYELTVFVLPGNQQETGYVRTLPSPPGLVAIADVGYVSVTLTWVPGSGEYSGFIVSSKRSAASSYTDLGQVGADVRSAVVTDLSPGVSYDFRVVTVSGEILTTYSDPTEQPDISTLLIVDDNFVVLDFNSTAISVAWRDADTPIIVDISPEDDDRINVNVGDRPVHTFTGLNPSTVYTITRLNQYEISVRTNPASPTNLRVSTTPTSFMIEWTAAASEVSRYKVEVRCADMTCSYSSVVFPNEELVYELTQLFPLREYLVTVSSCLDADGQFEEQAGDEPLDEGIITNGVPEDQIIVQETTTSNITILYATGALRGFVESIYPAGTTPPDGTLTFDSGPTIQRTFSGLIAGRLYTIQIRDLTNTFLQSINVRTRPSRPSFLAGNPTSTSIPIIWGASASDVSYYEVRYSPPDGSTPAVSAVDATKPRQLTIVTLLPQTMYAVFVRAVTGLDSTASISEAADGTFVTLAAQGGEIILHRITTTSIAYTFGEVPGASQYTVQLNLGTGTGIMQGMIHTPSDILGEFENLTPGQLYTLVLRVNNTEQGSIAVRTKPAPPESVSVEAGPEPYSSFIAEWTPPPLGTVFNKYEVRVSPANQLLTSLAETTTVDGSVEELLIENLLPELNYSIEVHTISDLDGFSSTSDPTEGKGRTDPFPVDTLIVTAYDTTTITVTWRKVEGVDFLAQIREVGREIGEDFSGLVRSSSSSTSILSFTYTNLVPGRNYELIIRSTDQNEEPIRAIQRTLPSPPTNPVAASLSAQSIRAAWTAAANDFEFYEVTVYPSSDSTDPTVMTIPSDQVSVDIDGLLDDTYYTVEIRTVSGSGDSLQKSVPVTTSATTEPIVMRVLSAEENVLLITFTHITGIFDDYRYGYRSLPSGTFTYGTLTRSGDATFDIQGLRSGSLYEITLDTRTGSVYREVDRIQARTRPSGPSLITPVTNLDDNSFTLEWVAPSTALVDYDAFRMTYEPADGALDSPLNLDKTRTSLFLTGLEPATEYTVTLVTVSGQGSMGQTSSDQSVTVTTDAGVPGGVNIKEVTETTIRITWNGIAGTILNPLILPSEGTSRPLATESIIFEGLTPGQLYTISVRSQVGQTTYPSTQQHTLPNPPEDLAITRTAAFELDVSWSRPSFGFYDSYTLSYSTVGASDVIILLVPASDDASVTLPDLSPETSYEVSIITVRGTVSSQPAETSGTTGRAPEGIPLLADRTTTTITISWGASTNPMATGYQVRIRMVGGTPLVFNLPVTDDTYTFVNLASGTTYIISLQIVGLADEAQDLSVTTYPQTPGAIQILSTTQTSITFAWGSAGGKFDHYTVNLYPEGSQPAFLQDVPRGSDLTISKNFLAPGTLYRIEIYAVAGSTRSEVIETTAATGDEVLTFLMIDSFGIAVSWSNAPDSANYYLQYDPSDGSPLSPITTSQESEFISELTPGQIYNFALSSGTPETGLAILARATYVLAPLAPSIEINGLSPTTILISILPASSGVLEYYRVDVLARTSGLGVGQDAEGSFNIAREACPEAFITDLVPGGTYDIEVVAVSGERDSPVVAMDVSQVTIAAGHLYLNDRTRTSLEVVWGAVTDTAFTNYLVYLFLGSNRIQTHQRAPDEEREVLLENLLAGTEYTVTLLLEGDSISQSSLTTATAPLAPVSLSFLSVEGQQVTLGWPSSNSRVDYYELCWTPFNQTQILSSYTTQQTLTLDQSDEEYTISLYAVLSVGVGDESHTFRSEGVTRFITLGEGLEGELNVTDFTTTSITVEWSEVVSISFQNYRLQATPEGGGAGTSVVISPQVARTYTFNSLVPGVLYTINNILEGTNPAVTRTVRQRTRPNPVSGLSQVAVTSQSISVSWLAASGAFDDYVVTYALSNDPTVINFADRIPSNGDLQAVIDGLLPDTSYVITVYTSSGAGSDRTASLEQSITVTTTALPPCSIQVTETTFTEITVQWGSCAGVVLPYQLIIEPNPAGVPPGSVPAGADFEYTYTSLVAGQRYIVGIRGTGSTEPYATDTVYTDPNVPTNLETTAISTSSLRVVWDVPTGGYEAFEVRLNGQLQGTLTTDQIEAGQRPTFTFDALRPGETYTVSIQNVVGTGSLEKISAALEEEFTTDSLNNGQISVIDFDPFSITVVWGEVHGAFNQYVIQFQPPVGNPQFRVVHRDQPRETTVTGLTPGQLQNISLSVSQQNYPVSIIQQRTAPLPPRDFRSLIIDDEFAILLDWSNPIGSIIDQYELTYSPADGLSYSFITLDSSTTFCTFRGLTPSRTYEFRMKSVTGEGATRTESTEVVVTAQASSAPFGQLILRDKTTNTISVTWGIGNDVNNIPEGNYFVTIDPSVATPILANNEVRNVEFVNLNPATLYTLELSEQGTSLSSLSVLTDPLPPNPVNVVVAVQSTTATATWNRFVGHDVNMFRVQYRQASLAGHYTIAGDVDGDTSSLILTGLDPTTEYDVEVYSSVTSGDLTAISDAARGSFSTGAIQEGIIEFRERTTTLLEVLWGSVPLSTGILQYAVSLTSEQGDIDVRNVAPSSEPFSVATFSGLTPGRLYRAEVDTIGTTTDYTPADIRTYPAAVDRLISIETGPTYVWLTWSLVLGDYDNLELTYVKNPDTVQVNPIPVIEIISSSETSFRANFLDPNSTYTFTLVTLSGGLRSAGREMVFNTNALQVNQIAARRVTTTTIDLVWGPSADASFWSIIVSPSIGPGTPFALTSSYTLTGLTPGQEYNITIIGNNVANSIVQRTFPEVPQSLQSIGQQFFLELQWSQPVGIHDGYRIRYTLDGVRTELPDLPSQTTRYTLRELDPGTTYSVSVLALSGELESEPATREFTTGVFEPLDLGVTESSNTSISLIWGVYRNVDNLPPLTNYELNIMPQHAASIIRSLDIFRARFNNLIPGVEYTIQLKLTTLDNPVTTVIQRTNPNSPASMIATRRNYTEIDLAFDPPLVGFINFYTLEFYRADGTDQPQTRTIASSERSVTIEELQPDTSYTFSLFTKSGTLTDFTTSEAVEGTFSTIAVPDLRVVTAAITCTTIQIFWARDPTDNIIYRIGIEPGPNDAFSQMTEFTFTGLNPATEYVITVTAFSFQTNYMSTYDSVTQQTRPKGPGAISLVRQTTTEIEITWLPAPGNFDSYRVFVLSEGSLPREYATILATDERHVTIRELDANVLYTINIETISSFDTQELTSCEISTIVVQTDKRVSPNQME